MRKILVIRGGALGDFILTLPALAALRGRFPLATVEVLGDRRFASLAIAGGLAHGASALDSPALAGLFARGGTITRATAEYFAGFELIISYLFDSDGIFQESVARISAARFIAGPHRPDETANVHCTEQLLRPLEELGIRDADPVPRLDIAREDRMNFAAGEWLALHPGSGSEQKNWPETKWRQLLEGLSRETRWKFLLVGGEAEATRCQRLAEAVPSKRARVAFNLQLVELARQMASCAGFVGHDSGITHLAAALGLPGVALWGPTAETVWRPGGDKIALLRDPRGLANLPVETVRKAILGRFRWT